MNVPAVPAADIMESVLIKGDLARLTPQERVAYYNAVCKSIGVNPLTQPLAYMNLQGKLSLYAKRDCADQLRRLRNVSIEIISQGLNDDLYSVHVQATDDTGRKDEDLGVVPLPPHVKGEFRANMILKAVTKAKRRVTLSICGLGFLDEVEVDSIPDAKIEPGPTRDEISQQLDDKIPEHADDARSATVASASVAAEAGPPAEAAAVTLLDRARNAARQGPDELRMFFNAQTSADKKELRKHEAELVKLYPPLTAQHGENGHG
jgi:hypothetical protein